jgi:hypothetical protein
MQSIQLNINEKLIQKIGIDAIRQRLQKELEFLYYETVAENIEKILKNSGIDNEAELELARKKAWEEYKKEFLKDIIK